MKIITEPEDAKLYINGNLVGLKREFKYPADTALNLTAKSTNCYEQEIRNYKLDAKINNELLLKLNCRQTQQMENKNQSVLQEKNLFDTLESNSPIKVSDAKTIPLLERVKALNLDINLMIGFEYNYSIFGFSQDSLSMKSNGIFSSLRSGHFQLSAGKGLVSETLYENANFNKFNSKGSYSKFALGYVKNTFAISYFQSNYTLDSNLLFTQNSVAIAPSNSKMYFNYLSTKGIVFEGFLNFQDANLQLRFSASIESGSINTVIPQSVKGASYSSSLIYVFGK